MQIPTLPTDNLYKFIALSGLLIVLVSFFIPICIMHQVNMQRFDIEADVNVAIEESRRLENKTNLLRQSMKDKSITKEEARLKNDEFDKISEKNTMNGIRLKSQLNKLKFTIEEIKDLKWLVLIGCGLGVVIAWAGFLLWYKRLQKYQDIIIRNEVAEK